tara:strand:+ start:3561 stop:4037 length:477 start_codon:yes stop_codon:yes gene_type:complete
MSDVFSSAWGMVKAVSDDRLREMMLAAIEDNRGYRPMYDSPMSYMGDDPYLPLDPADPSTGFRVPPSAVTPAMMTRGDVSSRELMEENEMLRAKVQELERMLDGAMASGAILGVGGHLTDDAYADTGSRLDYMESEGIIDAIMRRYAMMDPEMDGLDS